MIPAEFRAAGFEDSCRRERPGSTPLEEHQGRRVLSRSHAPHAGVRHGGVRRHAVQGAAGRKYNIQLNKTSRNSVLFQTNINNTRSDVALAHQGAAGAVAGHRQAAARRRRGGACRVRSARQGLDARMCPNCRTSAASTSAIRERSGGGTIEGDIRAAFFDAYNAAGCEHIPLTSPEIDGRLKRRAGAGLGQLRDPLSARVPDHGAGPGHHSGHHRLHAQARCEGDPRLFDARTGLKLIRDFGRRRARASRSKLLRRTVSRPVSEVTP